MAHSECEGPGMSTLTSSGPGKGCPGRPSFWLCLLLQPCHQHKVVFFFLLRISFLPEGSPSMHVACLPPGWNKTCVRSFLGSRNFLMLGLSMLSLGAWLCARHTGRPSIGRAAHVGTRCAFPPPHSVSSYLPLVRGKRRSNPKTPL